MQSFSQHLVQLVLVDEVDFETAAAAATNRHDFEIAVDQALRRKRVEEGLTEESAAVEEPEPGQDDDEPVALRVAN
jgi:Tfp pilus assembly ATPase PilU